jgi:hypothetical protein
MVIGKIESLEDPQVALRVIENETRLVDPKQIMAHHQLAASEIMKIVHDKKGAGIWYAEIQPGKKFLTYEAWILIAKFNNCHVELEGDLIEVQENSKTVAWGAYVGVYDAAGFRKSRAYMECSMDGFPTKGKQGRDKVKAAQSAAQTWAASKACRMAFSFVAVLAGAAATTADEMWEEEIREKYRSEANYKGDAFEREQVIKAKDMGTTGVDVRHDEVTLTPEVVDDAADTLDGGGWMYSDKYESWSRRNEGRFEKLGADFIVPWAVSVGIEHASLNAILKMRYGKTASKISPSEAQKLIKDHADGVDLGAAPKPQQESPSWRNEEDIYNDEENE